MPFSNTVGMEMSVPRLSELLTPGSGNYYNVSEYDSARGYYLFHDQDIKLLPEMP
jgi:hypothetical protein